MVVADPGPHTPMMLWTLRDARTGAHLTPGFSSMTRASAFLADARADHRAVPVDYIFRCDRARFQTDFPDLELVLDPSAAQFFARGGEPPPIRGPA